MNRRLLLAFYTIYACFCCSAVFAYLQPEPTPIVKYLAPINVGEARSGMEPIDCVYVINLDARPQKWERMQALLKEMGIAANRVSAVNGWQLSEETRKELFGPYPMGLTGGEVGCLLSHVSILKDAYDRGFELIWVLEDDVEFLGDIRQLPTMLIQLNAIDPRWDILYTDIDHRQSDGSYSFYASVCPRSDQSVPPAEYFNTRTVVGEGLMRIRKRYGTHSMLINRRGIEKFLNYFSRVYLWIPIDSDMHFVPTIRQYSSTRDIVTNLKDDAGSDTKNSTVGSVKS